MHFSTCSHPKSENNVYAGVLILSRSPFSYFILWKRRIFVLHTASGYNLTLLSWQDLNQKRPLSYHFVCIEFYTRHFPSAHFAIRTSGRLYINISKRLEGMSKDEWKVISDFHQHHLHSPCLVSLFQVWRSRISTRFVVLVRNPLHFLTISRTDVNIASQTLNIFMTGVRAPF